MNADDLIAIDVHVHLEHDAGSTDADTAARKRDRRRELQRTSYLTTPFDFRNARATSFGSCFSPSTL